MWNEDYKDMLCALVDESVDFLLVDAYALAAHGFPRATVDIDLWVRPSPENAEKVHRALARFGAPLSEVSAADFVKEDAVVQIGVAPRRIDFVTGVSGLTYDEASQGAVQREIDGVRVRLFPCQT